MNLKISALVILFSLAVLGLVECLLRLKFTTVPHRPVIIAWSIAAVNFYAAVTSALIGLKKSFKTCMIMVLGGSGLRILLMLIAVLVVMFKYKAWLMPFSVTLLGCFILFMTVEVALLYVKGIKGGNPA